MKSLTGNSIWHGLALLALCILLALPPVQADNRIRVSVTAFDNKVKGIFGNWSLGEGLAEMLTTELVNTGRFIVLERMAITDVLAEQELAQSGLVRSAGAPRTGGMLGAQVIVRGAVTEFSDAVSGYGGGLGYKGFGISGKSQKAVVGIDLRLIDASSGQVLASQHVTKDAQSSGGKINYSNADFRIGGGAFSRTPLGQAARAAISDAVTFVGRNTNLQLSSGATAPGLKIVKADATRIY
ncbi:MAG: hypothetical protein GY731_08790, partial [Gammaproteobacteria bacterium]|nr:hypothetical protein [Gammaproteobacteria bacterium]